MRLRPSGPDSPLTILHSRLHGGWLIATLMINISLMVPLAYLIVPHLRRTYHLAQLTSPQPARRHAALGYVASRAMDDPRIGRGAVTKLADADPVLFRQIVEALDRAGQWRRPAVPADPWLAWLGRIAIDADPEARILAAQRAAELHAHAGDPRVSGLLEKLIHDQEPDVRYNALVAAAELASAADPPTPYWPLLERAANDPQPQIARQAWLLAGLLDMPLDYDRNWRALPVPVAEAMLWAALRTTDGTAPIALEVIRDPSADPFLVAMAVYGLAPARFAQVPVDHDALDPIGWRWILKTEPGRLLEANPNGVAQLEGTGAPAAPPDSLDMRGCALAYRSATALPSVAQRLQTSFQRPLVQLAILEGLPAGDHAITVTAHMPQMVRWAAVTVTKAPEPNDLLVLFACPQPQMRDLACIVAAERLTRPEQEQLIGSLLHDFNDQAKLSGAILSGLTGARRDLLARRSDAEDIWLVRQVQRLGLWMQGQLDTFDPQPLLGRADVPKSTLLLAMLHRDRIGALDYLFNPRGEPHLDLIELFDHYRWWHVLRRYLPDDAPPFWLWADPALKQFQVEVLRNWYLVRRRRLE